MNTENIDSCRTRSVFDTINSEFGTPVFTYQNPNNNPGVLHWQPYSSDIKPCDFHLWSHIKDLVYKKELTDPICFKRTITDPFAINIKKETLEFVTGNFGTRLRYWLWFSEDYHFDTLVL
ncbi:uncharacterized protein CDAR_582791 [Caerostris darwini]|uniref:Uncharacterized protein n=1 Tax=Caerostris darwini TaxID=1538125 RepID=A0AAV4PJQ7_9ARAC|nr:uncharacterized protein CDAR_582791 [Caerostris darwini]